jgi:hypothetical protein
LSKLYTDHDGFTEYLRGGEVIFGYLAGSVGKVGAVTSGTIDDRHIILIPSEERRPIAQVVLSNVLQ